MEVKDAPSQGNQGNDDIGAIYDALSEAEAPEEAKAEDQAGDDVDLDDPDGDLSEGDDHDEEATTDPEPLAPHPRWSADVKDGFGKLPRDMQQFMLDRQQEQEAHFTQQSQELADTRKRYERLEQVLAPHEREWTLNGVDPAAAIGQLLAANKFLQEKPREGLQWLAQQLGVNLADAGDQSDEYIDPAAKAALDRVARLESTLTQQQQAASEAQARQAQQAVEAFRAETDDTGNPKHPHFDALRQDMMSLLRAGKANDLSDAYDQAKWLNPDIRESELKARLEKDAEERRERARKAKAAAKKVKGSDAVEVKAASSWREAAEQTYDALST